MKNYPKLESSDVRLLIQKKEEGYEKRLLVFQTPFGNRRMAELFLPEGSGPFPMILYVHWYEPESASSNRSQFVEEAIAMAKRGGMYGVLAGSMDQRPTHYVLMAATPRFSDWYLYLPKLERQEREAFIREMTEIDPITHIPNLSPAPILFQFGNDDFHVPLERVDEFLAAASGLKEKKIYACGHGLNEEAAKDRNAWLKDQLSLEYKKGVNEVDTFSI